MPDHLTPEEIAWLLNGMFRQPEPVPPVDISMSFDELQGMAYYMSHSWQY